MFFQVIKAACPGIMHDPLPFIFLVLMGKKKKED